MSKDIYTKMNRYIHMNSVKNQVHSPKKKYGRIIFEPCLGALFAIALFISHASEHIRTAVMIFGIIALSAICFAVATYIIGLKRDRFPIALPMILAALLFNVNIYGQPLTEDNTQMLFYIIVPCILAILLAFITVLSVHRVPKFKTLALSFLGNGILYFFLIFIVMIYVNYAFDMSDSSEEVFVITGEGDLYWSSVDGGTHEYPVEYTGDNPEVDIDSLELKTKYVFNAGDKVTVRWRRGAFNQIYLVDYTNAELDEKFLPNW